MAKFGDGGELLQACDALFGAGLLVLVGQPLDRRVVVAGRFQGGRCNDLIGVVDRRVQTGRPASALLAWRVERLDGELAATDERETFHRARRTPSGLQPLPDQSSGAQRMLGMAEALIRRHPDAAAARPGDEVMAVDL